MGQIYASAQQTIVWLEDKSPDVEGAIPSLEILRNHFPTVSAMELLRTDENSYDQNPNHLDEMKRLRSYIWNEFNYKIGNCYFHGFMYGAGMMDKFEEQEIDLV
jgi:hypothetical protein